MRTVNRVTRTSIKTENTMQRTEGETIERKIERIMNNKEGISEGADMIHTERASGIDPLTNVRTDKWMLAIDEIDKNTKTYRAQREQRQKEAIEKPKDEDPRITGAEPHNSGDQNQ